MGVRGHKPLEEAVEDVQLGHARDRPGVQVLRLGAVANPKDLFLAPAGRS